MSSAGGNDPKDIKKISSSVLDILSERGYSILGKIGKGSYATVYVSKYKPPASDEKTVVLACKVINTKKVPKTFAKKFLPREIEILRKVKHPNIIAVHSIFQQHMYFFIFMSFASKGDMLTFITKNGAIKEYQAYEWFRQATEAVRYLHSISIAHRDLKCENLLLSSKCTVKLSDFGFSRFVVDEKGRPIKSKTFCGSVAYAPPEVIVGTPYDPVMADMWSLGVILYVMLNKAMPFNDTNVKKIYECQMVHNWNFRDKVANFLSDDVKFLVRRLLQPNVVDRWTTDEIFQSSWFIKSMEMTLGATIDEEAEADEPFDCTNENLPEIAGTSAPEEKVPETSSYRLLTKMKKDNKHFGNVLK